MNKTEELLKSITLFVEKADDKDELKELLRDFPHVEKLIDAVDDYESVIAKLLRQQRADLLRVLRQYTSGSTTNPFASAMLEMVLSDAFEADDFAEKFGQITVTFLTATVSDLTALIMDSIDKDVSFQVLSQRTVKWIDKWGPELGELMKLNTHDAVQRIIREGIEAGESIQTIELKLRDLPQFDRNRARATAITEVLTANSVSQHEAYLQSPSVTGKTWKHSGSRGIRPRPAHVALSGTTIPLDEQFRVNGYHADYPRDIRLPAKERVYCHCVLSPSVDEAIFGLTREEKELIRQRAMREMQ